MSTFLALSITDASSHMGGCCSAQACFTIADLSVSPLLVAVWCSFVRVPRALWTSPIYSFPQLQGILYTTPVRLWRGSTSFTLVSWLLRMDIMMSTVLISYLLHTPLRSSLNPDTYGRQIMTLSLSSSCSLPPRSHCWSDNVFGIPIGLHRQSSRGGRWPYKPILAYILRFNLSLINYFTTFRWFLQHTSSLNR